ncbi:ABC transporter ATP-binding protein [Halostagnicola sp. A-GB9-2]|uniref:ABC transporter ATP-binding protein n=1 Tax=Halostagnicola sp. A-GB9-2 TaxID=3048066 RepID=UPI0024BF74DA|nr:ABC transporter ATP-binding protein [Halostagnicola sp. A-GB9-2]MDJ1433809.1 ABC transporter ATP-binding protein [Halostagnicola sp. A-GB9-2]
MSSNPLLSVEGLTVQFFTDRGTVTAVNEISFEIQEEEIVGLVGESGAGKSVASMSLLRLINGPGRIVEGEIRYKDRTLFALEEGPDGEPRKREDMLSDEEMRTEIRGNEIAVIFQDPMESLNPVYTVGNQLQEFIKLNRDISKKEARSEAIRMLREVGISDAAERYEKYPHEFSGGMRQRVLIAMALACKPNLIIADEPTTALDVTIEGQILDLVQDLQEKYGTSFLWVTHDMGVVADICEQVNVMYLGNIVEQAPVDDIFYNTKHLYTDALLDSMPRPDRTVERLKAIKGVMPSAIDPPEGCPFHTRCPDARQVCEQTHPDLRDVSDDANIIHRSACLKHDIFNVNYEGSLPMTDETKRQANTSAGTTSVNETGADR